MSSDRVTVRVEVFGAARKACDRRTIPIEVPPRPAESELAAALVEACPGLRGIAVREDLTGLSGSYMLNLNGTAFLDGGPSLLTPGDTLLLFSSQAGG